jgi:hypothetical protein
MAKPRGADDAVGNMGPIRIYVGEKDVAIGDISNRRLLLVNDDVFKTQSG